MGFRGGGGLIAPPPPAYHPSRERVNNHKINLFLAFPKFGVHFVLFILPEK